MLSGATLAWFFQVEQDLKSIRSLRIEIISIVHITAPNAAVMSTVDKELNRAEWERISGHFLAGHSFACLVTRWPSSIDIHSDPDLGRMFFSMHITYTGIIKWDKWTYSHFQCREWLDWYISWHLPNKTCQAFAADFHELHCTENSTLSQLYDYKNTRTTSSSSYWALTQSMIQINTTASQICSSSPHATAAYRFLFYFNNKNFNKWRQHWVLKQILVAAIPISMSHTYVHDLGSVGPQSNHCGLSFWGPSHLALYSPSFSMNGISITKRKEKKMLAELISSVHCTQEQSQWEGNPSKNALSSASIVFLIGNVQVYSVWWKEHRYQDFIYFGTLFWFIKKSLQSPSKWQHVELN